MADPLCAYCLQDGEYVPATIVDHAKQHQGELTLFWSWDNCQSLCKPCHDSRKQREEKSGISLDTTGLDGYPTKGTW